MFELGYIIRVAILLFCIVVLYRDRKQLNGAALLIIGIFFGLISQSCYDVVVNGDDPLRFVISSTVAGFALASTLYFHRQRDTYAEARHARAVAAELAHKNAELLEAHERNMAAIVGLDYDLVIGGLKQ
jgi:hypothetical protein